MITFIKKNKCALILMSLLAYVNSWKTCDQTFCRRLRQSPEGYLRYSLDLTSLIIDPHRLDGTLITNLPSRKLRLFLYASTETVFLMDIMDIQDTSETDPSKKIKNMLKEQLQSFPLKVLERTSNTVTIGYANIKATLYGEPFKIEFYAYDKLISIANPRNRFVYELNGNNTAIAMDVSFVGAQRAYGIPLHAERLSLQNTGPGGMDPYRLFNVNNGDYKIKPIEALSGAIPVLYGHGTNQSSGIFWYNFAQTWVDITVGPNQVDAFFMSEARSGMEYTTMLILTGPTLAEAAQQYSSSFSKTQMPQYFALGYHQSRQSYMTQDEVLEVVKEFDKNSLPLDSVWLDIDYTENKKSFTWDPNRFPNPLELQAQLEASNRKLVAAVDPQIKAERGYFVHDNATAKGCYVRNPGGSDYLGLGRSGLGGYLDFQNPYAQSYYGSLFSMESFKGTNLHIWNNMNEPVVFENENHENTLAGDLEHYYDGENYLKHRNFHNLYGTFQAQATHRGLKIRQNLRPFVVTRSHFSSIQEVAAVWTGDNYALWEHLEISFPMCLTEALASVSFCGADVGGFYGNPDDELYQRWYQAAAWLPLYRGNSAKGVPRREPYLYSEGIQSRIRTALNQRYAHLPVWYTLFAELLWTDAPVIRPITYHYSNEDDALSIDNEILVGANILAAPVLKKGAFIVPVYLPGGASEIWYNIDDNYKVLSGTGYHLLQVRLSSVPVFYRGGSIIPRKDISRQSTVDTHKDPYTLYICLDKNNQAEGTLYVDDYETFNFVIKKQYLYLGFSFVNNVFSSYKIHPDADYDGAAGIGQMVILSPPKNIAGVKLISKNANYEEIKLTYSEDGATLTINNMLLSLKEPFKIELYVSGPQN